MKRYLDSSGNPLHYLIKAFEHTFSNIKFNYGSTIQIEKLLKLLNLKTHMDMLFSETLKLIKQQSFTTPVTCICNKSLSK